jgi:hypothetical protein
MRLPGRAFLAALVLPLGCTIFYDLSDLSGGGGAADASADSRIADGGVAGDATSDALDTSFDAGDARGFDAGWVDSPQDAAESPVTYVATFDAGLILSASSVQCIDWEAFRASLTGTYTSVTISGTYDTTGVTCTGSTADVICQAMHEAGTVTAPCNGRQWNVGFCQGAVEINASGCICCCLDAGYNVAPCYPGVEWGGVNTNDCPPPAQSVRVSCQ